MIDQSASIEIEEPNGETRTYHHYKPGIGQFGHPRIPVLEYGICYFVALDPLMERGIHSRPPLMAVDGQGVSCWIDTQVQHVTYHGTLALLEQYPSMQLTNPQTQVAEIRVFGFYRDADAPLTATPLKIRMKNTAIFSDTGVKFQDLIQGVRCGKSCGENILDTFY